MNMHEKARYEAATEALLDNLGDEDREAVTKGAKLIYTLLRIDTVNAEKHFGVLSILSHVLFNDFKD